MGQETITLELHECPSAARLSETSFEAIAEAQIHRLMRQAEEKGRRAGSESIARAGAERLDQACLELEQRQTALEQEALSFAVRFAIDIARVIIRREIAEGRQDLERIVRETLAHSGVERASCTVHLSPKDFEALANVQFRAGTTLAPDPEVARGDVHVTTAQGLFVREIDSILQSLKESLSQEVRHGN